MDVDLWGVSLHCLACVQLYTCIMCNIFTISKLSNVAYKNTVGSDLNAGHCNLETLKKIHKQQLTIAKLIYCNIIIMDLIYIKRNGFTIILCT